VTVTNLHGMVFKITVEKTEYEHDPLVIFWEDRVARCLGTKVQSYYLSTLLRNHDPAGLCLYGSDPAMYVTAENLKEVTDYVIGLKR
jgi:hypothetical protein